MNSKKTSSAFVQLFCMSMTAVFVLAPLQGFSEEVIDSRAVGLFQSGDYESAASEFEQLTSSKPGDTLAQRYLGMSYILTGRLDDAVQTLEKAIEKDPQSPALHYYLARAYHEQGLSAEAEKELQIVLELDPKGYYAEPAREAMNVVIDRAPVAKKLWSLYGYMGYEYDSNVPLTPNDKALRGTTDHSAGRYFFSIGGTYKFVDEQDVDSTMGYRVYQSLHDDNLNEFNYTYQELFNVTRYGFDAMNRRFVLGLRTTAPLGFLDGNLFSWGVEATPFLNVRPTDNTYVEVYNRFSALQFGPDGRLPDQLSRDGIYNSTGVEFRRFFYDFAQYVSFSYEMQNAMTQGNSFDRFGQIFSVGYHAPIVKKLVLDTIGSFTVAHYPHYSAEIERREPTRRLDNDWSILVRLTYELSKNWSVQTYYRYVNANNENDLFQYDRHIGGTQLNFRY